MLVHQALGTGTTVNAIGAYVFRYYSLYRKYIYVKLFTLKERSKLYYL
jgi:hypothetical protein